MPEPICSPASFVNGVITTDMPLAEISESIMAGNIFVLKGAFAAERDDLIQLRHAVFDWAQTNPAADQPEPTENSHCMQAGVSRLQQTPHVYHSFNFNRISQLPIELAEHLYKYFRPLCDLQNALTGNNATLENFDGVALHPQLIQYPLGGGIFGRHFHPLEPQRIGLIVALTQRGTDFSKGGTCFEVDGKVIDIEPYHDLGDIAFFRFNIPHWVNPSDLGEKFAWESERGRWTMVLPYY
ncbi:MAG TPA: hypothetical protein VE977_08065 [Pyrinomonadaceae bacterium]|nr:hypothetical protein [Pyrinomonadaceae bacterium]